MIRINDDLWVNPVNVERVEARAGGVKITFVSGDHVFSPPNNRDTVTRSEVVTHAEMIAHKVGFGVDA